jgi:tetratricopeptide (TPR) repeat protein
MKNAQVITAVIVNLALTLVLGGCSSEAKGKIDTNVQECINYNSAQDYVKAIESGKKAIKSSPKNIEGYICLGDTYNKTGENKAAIEVLKKGESIGKEKLGLANLSNRLGEAYSKSNDLDEGIKQYNRSLILSREIGFTNGVIGALNGLATIFGGNGQSEKAIEYYNEALKLQPEDKVTALIYANIGDSYGVLKRYDDAEIYLIKGFELSEKTGDYHNQAINLMKLGTIYYAKNDLKRAEATLLDSITRIRKVGDVYSEASALKMIGFLNVSLGNNTKALNYLEQSLSIFTRIGKNEESQVVQDNISRLKK